MVHSLKNIFRHL